MAEEAERNGFKTALLSVVLPGLVGVFLSAIAIWVVPQYGFALFCGMPLTVGFASGACPPDRCHVSIASAIARVFAAMGVVGAGLILFSVDGLVCILMAFPLGIGLSLVGLVMARSLYGTGVTVAVVLAFPLLMAFDVVDKKPPLRKAVTQIEVNAPIEQVWQTVIAFPPIQEPPAGVLAAGIAYPVSAHMEGHGVGAIRYCTFSTGSFVEPITRWEEPDLLAFSVTENPPAMHELSPYRNLETPHMTGHMVSERGQFRLYEKNGKTIMEGTTWYRHDMSPQWYWGPISDHIIHAIHNRVLGHIKRVAENKKMMVFLRSRRPGESYN